MEVSWKKSLIFIFKTVSDQSTYVMETKNQINNSFKL